MEKNLLQPLSFLLLALLTACTAAIAPKPSLGLPPLIERYPLHIGFHHNKSMNNYLENVEGDSVDYEFILDEPSAEFFTANLKYMFKNVDYIEDFSSARIDHLNGVIVTHVEKFKAPTQGLLNQAEIVYVFMLFDRQKKPVGTLRIWGKGTSDKRYFLNTVMQDATELAIKDAMAQFMVAFEKHPRFKRWLTENGAAPYQNIQKLNED